MAWGSGWTARQLSAGYKTKRMGAVRAPYSERDFKVDWQRRLGVLLNRRKPSWQPSWPWSQGSVSLAAKRKPALVARSIKANRTIRGLTGVDRKLKNPREPERRKEKRSCNDDKGQNCEWYCRCDWFEWLQHAIETRQSGSLGKEIHWQLKSEGKAKRQAKRKIGSGWIEMRRDWVAEVSPKRFKAADSF